MEKLNVLIDKTTYSIKNDGYKVFAKKTKGYIIRHIKREKPQDILPAKTYMDVLFINGCFLPHPSRYRVSHQREQLLASNIASNEVLYEDLTLDLVKKYRVFIFYRCPYTDMIGKFIEAAKKSNKTVLYDIDDLVIDTKYTDQVKYLSTITKEEKDNYDEGVRRMQKTLLLCEAAITTTERLANELKKYVPEVFINRNTASERMVELSNFAIYYRDVLPDMDPQKVVKQEKKLQQEYINIRNERDKKVRLGYFSGSITHNDDFLMILPVIIKLLSEYDNLELSIVGELDIPDDLLPFKNRINVLPFVKWGELPQLISSVDINLVPMENTIFNEAKSENKWVEAALVKVVTIASNVGAFRHMMKDYETGFLCDNNEEWYEKLKLLIENKEKRKIIAQQAYEYVNKNCTAIYTSHKLHNFIKSKMKPNVAFVLPSTQTSGGVLVAFTHCNILKNSGYDVLIINDSLGENSLKIGNNELPVISRQETHIHGSFDKVVATLWSTVTFLASYPNIKEKYYLVQGFETDFSKPGSYFRIQANQSYHACFPLHYITVSKWCAQWLKDSYNKDAKYAPNGIDISKFTPIKRNFNCKIRILVEGNCDDSYKNIDESFMIIDQLDKTKFEIWYMSYQGKPKKEYYVDKFLHRVPYEKVPEVYGNCHILLKSSILESFSYPPLEMMATGGYCVVHPNDGNVEYLRDEENCLFYEQGNISEAVNAIERICNDSILREKLYRNGIKTAQGREWNNIKDSVLDLYDVDNK